MNDELFELCKEVHNRTGWVDAELSFIHKLAEHETTDTDDITVRYTSDYLLEKLPGYVYDGFYLSIVKDEFDGTGYYVGYFAYGEPEHFYQRAETPLKALLKLVIALDDAGVKL